MAITPGIDPQHRVMPSFFIRKNFYPKTNRCFLFDNAGNRGSVNESLRDRRHCMKRSKQFILRKSVRQRQLEAKNVRQFQALTTFCHHVEACVMTCCSASWYCLWDKQSNKVLTENSQLINVVTSTSSSTELKKKTNRSRYHPWRLLPQKTAQGRHLNYREHTFPLK